MAIHWNIPFKALRSGIVYNINIYDASYTGSVIYLNGGANPITTEEDDDDDFFCNIRTQSGVLRILDNGKDANGNALSADWWKSFVPDSDTDRPITITHRIGRDIVIDWQGFIQAQNFGFTLFGDPQIKEFPIQCALTVLEGTDIDPTHVEIENFAYLLRECLNDIDRLSGGTISDHEVVTDGVIHINNIFVQGGADARTWLLKRVDWQNFIARNTDDLEARYTLYEVLQDICRFWGWTARTYADSLYLTRADDSDRTTFAMLDRTQLSEMASGTDASDTLAFGTVALDGEEFVSINNVDYRQRGHNKAVVKADCCVPSSDYIIEMDDKVEDLMADQGWNGGSYTEDDVTVRYTTDLLSFTRPLVTGTCRSTYAAFALADISSSNDQGDGNIKIIRIKKSFSSASAQAYVQFTTVYHHSYSDGYFLMHGKTYRRTELFEDFDDRLGSDVGRKRMYMRLGVGKTRSTAKWYNGNTWSNTETTFKASIGNGGDLLYTFSGSGNFSRVGIPAPNVEGILFVEFLGSDDLDNLDNQKSFELADFCIEFYKSDEGRITERPDLPSEMEYTSKNQNNVRAEWNADCIYASDNDMAFGYGLLINPDGSFMKKIAYGSDMLFPEQQLANRVTDYWSTARRMVSMEINGTLVSISPNNKVTLDGTTFYPIAISQDWWNDKLEVTMVELPTT